MFIELILIPIWLGILTSISPCPLTTNIAAVSFISKTITHPYKVFLSGIGYALGRATLYTLLGIVLSFSLLSIPDVSVFFQNNMSYVLAPIMIVIGLVILNVIHFRLPQFNISEHGKKKIFEQGIVGSFLIGILFALALCPVSAGLFFGSLIQTQGAIPSLIAYGIGTGIPVIVVAFILSFSAQNIGRVYHKLIVFEQWSTKITGIVFVLIGFYILIDTLI